MRLLDNERPVSFPRSFGCPSGRESGDTNLGALFSTLSPVERVLQGFDERIRGLGLPTGRCDWAGFKQVCGGLGQCKEDSYAMRK